jgi:hypothetical protein
VLEAKPLAFSTSSEDSERYGVPIEDELPDYEPCAWLKHSPQLAKGNLLVSDFPQYSHHECRIKRVLGIRQASSVTAGGYDIVDIARGGHMQSVVEHDLLDIEHVEHSSWQQALRHRHRE